MSYSVTESAGSVTIAIIKKNNTKELSVRVKSRDGSGTSANDYDELDEIINFKKRDVEKTINVKIHDNHQW